MFLNQLSQYLIHAKNLIVHFDWKYFKTFYEEQKNFEHKINKPAA
jgi:hypothetical protein